MTTSPTTPPPPLEETPTRNSGNVFKRLYKMSTTAGVGAHDYVAVNTPAVVAVIAGLASALVLFSPALLVVPIFTLIVGIVAFMQIRKSSGTQTGTGLAIVGILLATLFSGVVLFQSWQERQQLNRAKDQIAVVIQKLGDSITAGNYQEAYDLFVPAFKSAISLDRFTGELKSIEAAPELGRITKFEWNRNHLEKLESPEASNEYARAAVKIHFTNTTTPPAEATPVFVRAKGSEQWSLVSIAPLFQNQPPPAPNRGGGQ